MIARKPGLLALALLFTGLLPAAGGETEPRAVVTRLHDGIVASALDPALPESLETMIELVSDTHDLVRIGRVVMGRHWRTLDEDQRAVFVRMMTRLSAATYLGRLAGAEGVGLEITGGESVGELEYRVDAAIVPREAARVPLQYHLRHDGTGWRIVNVIADGVSDLALRRAEYDRLMRDRGFDGLLEALEHQIRAEISVP